METAPIIQRVSNVLSILEAAYGGRVACEAAEELLLLATAMIWRTAGAEHACGRLDEMRDEMARPTG